MSHQVRLDRFEEWFIARMARRLADKAGFTTNDVEDIAQDIRLDVLQRLRRFDPTKSNRHTFVAMVVHRCAATILESQRAEKRNRGRRPQSLNAPIRDAQGREVELHQTLDAAGSQPGRHEEELRDLIADVRSVVASLPDDLRPWCTLFAEMGIRAASREHRVPRSRLQRLVREIRAAFEASGLNEYLREI